MAHLHTIYDSDLHFVIDPVTRVITNQSANKNSLIQFDHNSERFTFELPRYIEEHDMLGSNRVEVHYVNIDAKTGNQSGGVYDVRDLQVSPNDDKVVICSWLVSNNATQYAGTLNFVIRFACTTGDTVDYVWNTAVFKNYQVQSGLYNSDPIVNQYPDVIAQWYQSLFTASADGVTNIQEARAAAITAIDVVADERIADVEQAGRDVVASLPADYVALTENVAPPIVETATGAAIAVKDSANRKLRGLNLYGKSTQDGTPTPEAPVEIESVENPTVRVCGKNILLYPYDEMSRNRAGVTFTVHEDGTVLVDGTSEGTYLAIAAKEKRRLYVDGGVTYNFSCVPSGGSLNTYYAYINVGDETFFDTGEGVTITPTTSGYTNINIVIKGGYVAEGLLMHPQLEQGEASTSYEPYTEQTLPVTRTLPGIPVASGGNYTDENGQQWVCDEMDFERGVYVSRTKLFDLSSLKANTWYTWGVNHSTPGTTGFYHYFDDEVTNVMVLSNVGEHSAKAWGGVGAGVGVGTSTDGDYFIVSVPNEVLADTSTNTKAVESFSAFIAATEAVILAAVAPIETALTAEELAAYASLRSNYPNTTVLNDGGAGMTVSYVADTKLYIDNKFSV